MGDFSQRRKACHEELIETFAPLEVYTYYDEFGFDGFKLQVEMKLDALARSNPGQIYAEIETAIGLHCESFGITFERRGIVFTGLFRERQEGE